MAKFSSSTANSVFVSLARPLGSRTASLCHLLLPPPPCRRNNNYNESFVQYRQRIAKRRASTVIFFGIRC